MSAEFQTREFTLKAVAFIGFSSLVARRACGQAVISERLRPHCAEGGETGGRGGPFRGRGVGAEWGRMREGTVQALRPDRTGRGVSYQCLAVLGGGPGVPGSSAAASSALSCLPKGRQSLSPSGTPTVPGASRGSESGLVVIPTWLASWSLVAQGGKVTLQSCQTRWGPSHPPTSRKPHWPEMVPHPPPHCVPATFYR